MTQRVPSGNGRDGREERGAPELRFCPCAPPREPQKSTRRPGGQGDSPGPPLRSTVLPPRRPGTCSRHLTGSRRNPCSGGLSTATAHLVCVTLHAVFKQFTCFNLRDPPQPRRISTPSWPYRGGDRDKEQRSHACRGTRLHSGVAWT